MKKTFGKIAAAVLSPTILLFGSCAKADPNAAPAERSFETSRVYSYDYTLSDEELAERYADLLPKLYSFGEENTEEKISAEGLAYFTEMRDRALEEYALGEYEDQDEEEFRRMYDFMLDDRQFFPAADGGLFAVYGYRTLGALWPTYYDVFFLSASEEALLFSEPLSQGDTDFLGNGERLMIFSYDRPLMPVRILDRDGESAWRTFRECEMIVPAEAE